MRYKYIIGIYRDTLNELQEQLDRQNPVEQIFHEGLESKFLILAESCVFGFSDEIVNELRRDFEQYSNLASSYLKIYEVER